MADEITKRKKVRSAHRGAATKLIKRVKEKIDNEGFVPDAEKAWLKQQISSGKDKIETLRAQDDDLITLMAADGEDDTLESILEEGDQLRADLQEIIYRMEDLFLPKAETYVAPMLPASPLMNSSISQGPLKVMAKLPKLDLPKFGGQLQEWQEFWDSFESTVGNNDTLADVDKFKYLKSLLKEPAKSTIAGFALTSANYQEAVDLLKRRYGRRDAIQKAHIDDLLSIHPVSNENDVWNLRKFHDESETHFRGLEALGVNNQTYSTIVVPSLLGKLPTPFRLSITRGQEFKTWSMEELLERMRAEIELREEHCTVTKERRMWCEQKYCKFFPHWQREKNEMRLLQ